MVEETPPKSPKNFFSGLKNWIKDRRLPKEMRPGANRVHMVTEKKRLRNQSVVAAADEVAQQISNMADTGQYPLLTKWLEGKADKMEIKQAKQIIDGLRSRVASKYGVNVQDLEKERDDEVSDFL